MSGSRPADCPFCAVPPERVVDANALAFALQDAYPVAAGHTLLVARRHVADLFELTDEELGALLDLLRRARRRLDESLQPAGYNVGVNVGRAAGQTIGHVHVHLIPRFAGDVSEPEGGVRNVIPGKGMYRTPDRQ
jgi:diadenosine tetraphosphate (Ap4A) HIT family hydrolase